MEANHENQKPVPEINFKPWRVFIIEAFLFSLTLGLGITTSFRMSRFYELQKITLPQISFLRFIIYFLLATLFLFFVTQFLKFKKEKGIIFKSIFALAVFLGSLFFLETFFSEPFPLILSLFLIFWWWKSPSVLNQDILMIFGIAGMGSALGLALQPLLVVGLLILFSIYDFIAVYKTKHMIKIAKEMLESRAILAFIIPPDLKNFQESLEKIQPGGKFLILGGGDVAFPLLFCVSLIPFGVLNSLIVAIFSLIGLLVGFLFFLSREVRQPIPALPPIALFSIIGFLITRLI